MQLRTLHILCDDSGTAKQVRETMKDCDSIIEQWEHKNENSISLYALVDDQDQDLLDSLQDIAEKKDAVRLIVQPIDASFPKSFQDEKNEHEENKPLFFDIISREEMSEIVTQQARFNGSYLSLIILSAIVATIALIEGNIAILIGAMVLTPLLGPNLALAFSTATADTVLTKRAIISGVSGFGVTFIVALITGFIIGEPPDKSIVPMLIGYGFESIPIAVCAGLAATILLLQGTLSSLIGVMVAVAFLPPIAMTGLALSSGDFDYSTKALMLFAINLASFNLAAKAVLLIAGIRPRHAENDNHSLLHNAFYIAAWALAIILLSVGLYFGE